MKTARNIFKIIILLLTLKTEMFKLLILSISKDFYKEMKFIKKSINRYEHETKKKILNDTK